MRVIYNNYYFRMPASQPGVTSEGTDNQSDTESLISDFYRELYNHTFPLKKGEVADITKLEELLANAMDSFNLFCQLGRKWDTIVGNLSKAFASYLEDTTLLPEDTRVGVMRTVADLQKLLIDLCRYKQAIGDNNRFYETQIVELKKLKQKEMERLRQLQAVTE